MGFRFATAVSMAEGESRRIAHELILVDEIKRTRLTSQPPFAPSNGAILVRRVYVLLSISVSRRPGSGW